MSRRLLRTSRFEQDLLELFEFIAADNLDAAEPFLDTVQKRAQTLIEWPRWGRAWDSPHPRLSGVRVLVLPGVRKYLLFYRPVEQGIELPHVFNGAVDLEAIFNETPSDATSE